ncbi:hypothetical protein Tco_1243204 [Tanacetum coccineum]
MYSFNLENIVPSGGLACLIAKATVDESNKWHRRLGHKGKQHKASCKAKSVSSISQPLQLLHMEKTKKKRSISKQGRKAVKSSKGAPSVQIHTDWDGLDTDLKALLNEAIDYTLAQDEEKTDSKVEEPKTSSKTEELHLSGNTLVAEDKGSTEKGGSAKSTNLQQSTVKPDESTVKPDEGTDKQDEGTDRQVEGTAENKDQDSRESATPTFSTTTSTPTPIVFGEMMRLLHKRIKSNSESEDINKAEKKFKMHVNDEEMARKVQEEWEAEEEKKRLAKKEATKAAFTNEAKLLHDTIAAQRRFLTQQRSEAIRNKLPLRTQLRNQMMTYLKHVEGKKHSDLKTMNFEEIQVLYEKVKRSDENFIAIASVKDERLIKDLNKKAAGIKKADSIKEESKEEEALDEDKEVDYEILDKKYPITEWKSEYLGIKPQYDETKDLEEINLNVDWNIVSWKLHGSSGVHTLMTEAGLVIHMLVEKKYPLRKKVLVQMLELKLESEKDIKSWLVQEQTVPGKDKSNQLIADSLLKTTWLSMHHVMAMKFLIHLVVYNEELAIPEQTATGKGTSNPLMASSLPKTIKPT